MLYFETSCKNSVGVSEALQGLVGSIISSQFSPGKKGGVTADGKITLDDIIDAERFEYRKGTKRNKTGMNMDKTSNKIEKYNDFKSSFYEPVDESVDLSHIIQINKLQEQIQMMQTAYNELKCKYDDLNNQYKEAAEKYG